jgi:hypothetical protein
MMQNKMMLITTPSSPTVGLPFSPDPFAFEAERELGLHLVPK